MKKTFTRLTALALALNLLLTSCGSGASAATMHLRKTEGTVAVSDSEGKDVVPRENLGLYSGYQVGTQAESYAWIDLDKVKLTKLDAGSKVEIVKEGKELEIDVKSGSLFFNVTEPLADDETMNIRTSTMVIGIRGTCGWVTEDAAALLEGTVSVTAGDQEVTVNAGEMAVLTDGTLEVKPLTAASVPAFVREEILKDEDLAVNIRDTTGMDLTEADPMAPYGELLNKMEDVVYSEVIDFEQDNSPELLIIYKTGDASGIDIWRSGADKPYSVFGMRTRNEDITYSLAESDGRLFVYVYFGEGDSYIGRYFGSVAPEDGEMEDWGTVDELHFGPWGMVAGAHTEQGFVDYSISISDSDSAEAVWAKYVLVRELVSF